MTTLRARFEQRTGILVGTFRAHSHWSRYLPLYVGAVGGWGPDCHGFWRQWLRSSGVSVSTFGRAAYVTVCTGRGDSADRLIFRWAVVIFMIAAWLVIS